jgi:signal transduction histidine kinase
MFKDLFTPSAGELQEIGELRTELLDVLFDQMPIGMAVIDQSMSLVRVNNTWCAFLQRYAPLSNLVIHKGMTLFDLFPDERLRFTPVLDDAFGGTIVRREALVMQRDGVRSYWDVVITPLRQDEEIHKLLIVIMDASDRVFANRLLEEKEAHYRVAEGLRDILNIINSNRSLETILDYIVAQASRLLGTDSIAIFGYHPQTGILDVQTSIGLEDDLIDGFEIHAGRGEVGRAISERRHAIVPDLGALKLAPDDSQRPLVERWTQRFKALLAVPLIARDEIYGAMAIFYPQRHDFTKEEIELVVAVCDQAALAIENARLRAQATQTAVAEERSRLARELHDAVTQTLFSASLIAEVLPRLWERDRAEGLRRLADLRQLTRGALAEMRTLLLELRPATLTEVELRELLRQLCEALTGRARIPVDLEVDGITRPLSPDVQLVFYRIAQEALNNVFKHANATSVRVRLIYLPACVCLTISDDGRGFEPSEVSAERLGLKIMHERAEGIGADLELINPPEGGTRISLRWTEEDVHE